MAAVVLLVLLAAAALWGVVHQSPHQRRKREQRALELVRQREASDRWLGQQWMAAVAHNERHAQWDGYGYTRAGLAHITFVYGAYPQRGTKAMIRWYGGDGGPQDTWFELAWPRVGDWLFVRGGYGYGRHNCNPETFYAFIVHAVPAGAWEAWQRQLVAG